MTAEYSQTSMLSWVRESDQVVIYQSPNDENYPALAAWLAAGNVLDNAIVPSQITRWQAWQIMLATPSFKNPSPATLFGDVQAIVTATGGTMQYAWANQQYLYRHGPFLTPALMAAVGVTSAQLDALFIAAQSLPP